MWIELFLFASKALFLVGLVVAAIVLVMMIVSRVRDISPEFEIDNLNDQFRDLELSLKRHLLPPKETKALFKAEKKREKLRQKDKPDKRIFILDFDGDVKASAVENLRREISALLTVADPKSDEVLVRLESPGGMVHSYGFAAAQLNRIRTFGLHLTIAVDKVAASGGYMMAVCGTKIIAAPFAILGSVGVVAQVPNIHRLLKKNDIDYQEMTAGEYKRTVSLFGEITEKGRSKFVEQLEHTHQLFKDFILRYRPQLNMADVATGEYWYGEQALKHKLVDEISTSDEFLFSRRDVADLIQIKIYHRPKLSDKFAEFFQMSFDRIFAKLYKELFFKNLH